MNPYSIDSEGALVGPGAPFRIGVETVNKMNYAHRVGIAEGLRMTAKTFMDLQWKAFKTGVPIHWFDFYQAILAKAKEVEEAKVEK